MRSAELADLTRDAARTAIASRDLVGARDIASVLGARIRARVYPMTSQDHRSAAASRGSGASRASTCMTNRKVCSRRRCTDRLYPAGVKIRLAEGRSVLPEQWTTGQDPPGRTLCSPSPAGVSVVST